MRFIQKFYAFRVCHCINYICDLSLWYYLGILLHKQLLLSAYSQLHTENLFPDKQPFSFPLTSELNCCKCRGKQHSFTTCYWHTLYLASTLILFPAYLNVVNRYCLHGLQLVFHRKSINTALLRDSLDHRFFLGLEFAITNSI